MPPYTLVVLGGAALRDARGPVTGPLAQRRRVALLAMLAAAGERGVARERVAALLWADSPDDRARHALAQYLFLLRRDLGDPQAVTGTAELRLNPDVVASDLAHFAAAVAANRLDEAAAAYGGPFLDGFRLPECDGFERWAEEERTRLASEHRRVLLQLAGRREAAGDTAGAVEAWRRAASADPLDARVACRLMEALEAAGDRTAALAHARVHEQLVRAALDESPDPRVTALAERLRSAPVPARPAAQRVPPSDHSPAEPPSDGGVAATLAIAAAAAGAHEGPSDAPPFAMPETRQEAHAAVAPAPEADSSAASPPQGARTVRRGRSARRARRHRTWGVLALGAFGVLALFGWRRVTQARTPRLVVVAPLENRTGDARLDAFGLMAADWITQGLARTREFEVVDARTAQLTAQLTARLLAAGETARSADALAATLAAETGAGTVVEGRYYASGDSVTVLVRMVDVPSGRVRGTTQLAGASTALPALVERLAAAVAGSVAAARDTTATGEAIRQVPPPSYEAYRATADAWARYHAGDVAGGLAHAARAEALDSAYVAPTFVRAWLLTDRRAWPAADSVVRRLAGREPTLQPAERAVLEVLRTEVAGAPGPRLRAAEELAHAVPTSVEFQVDVAHRAVIAGRPRRALDALARLDTARGLLAASPIWWTWRATALHLLGEHAPELAAAQVTAARFPARAEASLNLVRAHAATGDARAAARVADAATGERWALAALRRRALVEAARELRAHGHAADGDALLARALAATSPSAVSAGAEADAAAEREALILLEAGRRAEARDALQALVRRAPTRLAAQGALGVALAQLGDRAGATAVEAALAAWPAERHPRGRHTMWRARVQAALGDAPTAVALVRRALDEGYPALDGYASSPELPRDFDYSEPSPHADPWLASLARRADFRAAIAPAG